MGDLVRLPDPTERRGLLEACSYFVDIERHLKHRRPDESDGRCPAFPRGPFQVRQQQLDSNAWARRLTSSTASQDSWV